MARIVHVNDCAFVGSTIIKSLSVAHSDLVFQHITRTRGMLDKTFGIALKILMAKAELFHVHYLLQDCYLVNKFRRIPVIGHAHGSDLRATFKSRNWGWVVRSNLKDSDKIVVSTPDILALARDHRDDSEYIPNPVDMTIFQPKPFQDHGHLVVFNPCDMSYVKGTHVFVEGFAKFQKSFPSSELRMIDFGAEKEIVKKRIRKMGVRNVKFLPEMRHEDMAEQYWNSDIVAADFNLGILLMVSLEAMACGRPVVQYLRHELYENAPVRSCQTPDEISAALSQLSEAEARAKVVASQMEYVTENHHPEKISRKILKIYRELTNK